MKLLHMRPDEIRTAVSQQLAVLLPVGVCEYHGPHLPVGVDFLIAKSLFEEVEKRCPCVLAPGIQFGPTMGWAGGSADGDADFNPAAFSAYAKEELRQLLLIGFRRIYALTIHQGPDGLQASCLKRAAAELSWEMAHSWPGGWGRTPDCPDPSIFGMIKIATDMDKYSQYPEGMKKIALGHAGKGETQLILAKYPELVRMDLLGTQDFATPEWLLDSGQADADEGLMWLDFCAEGWAREINKC
ncbi:MAG: creatininase family protein [Clostridiales bacterium]|nr:creatininase family protein [Clostridiales bacterium]